MTLLDETGFYAFAIVTFNSILLLMYHFKIDPNKKIERFYFKKNKIEYGLFKAAYFIILVSFILSLRYVVHTGFSLLTRTI